MDIKKRILLAIGILLIDLVLFFLPLSAIFMAYVIIYNPPWVRDFFEKLDTKG
jgi:hypothetical protein